MKRAFVVLALCLVLALVGVAAWAVPVSQAKEQVIVTAQTLAGDPGAAEGLTARQGAVYENHLVWEMTIPASQPENTVTDFTRYLYDSGKVPQAPESFGGIQVYTMTSFGMGLGGTGVPLDEDLSFFTSSDQGLSAMKPLFLSVCANAEPGESYTETVRPTDFLSHYPLSIDSDLPQVEPWRYSTSGVPGSEQESNRFQEFYTAFQNFFAIPIPEEARWEVTVCTTENGNLQELGVNAQERNAQLNTVSAVGETTCYLAFLSLDETTAPDLSQVPGGPGIYAVDYGANQIYEDTLRNFFPLPDGELVRALTLAPDGETLALLTHRDGSCTCTLIDTTTAAVRQRLCPSEHIGSSQGTFDQQVWGEDSLLLYGSENFVLYEKQADGSYAYAFAMAGAFPSTLITSPVFAWDGAKLAIGTVSYDRASAVSFTLFVYWAGQLTYWGQYESSLNQLSDPAQAQAEDEAILQTFNRSLPGISILQANPLSLAWP